MTTERAVGSAVVALTAAVATCSARAHHGTSTFDGDTVVALEGTIIENRWTNPHSYLVVEVRRRDGVSREVVIEADGPSLIRPLGATRDSLAVGDSVVVYASPSRLENSDEYLGREIIKSDGSLVPLSARYARAIEAGELEPATSVVSSWMPDRSALFEFVPWRGGWPLTEAGRAAFEAYDVRRNFAQAECIPATAPTVMVYPTAKVIEDRGDHLLLDTDWMGAKRTIYLDGRPAPAERTLQGHSVGRFQGRTLVVETTHFADNPMGNAFGVPSGARKRIVERFELADDGRSLTYGFELSDPEYLIGTVGTSFVWHHRPDVSASGVACDPGAASRYLHE